MHLGVLALALVLWAPPLSPSAAAQEDKPKRAAKVPRIAYLSWASPASRQAQEEAFRQGLRQLGYVESQSIAVDYRYGGADQLPDLAAELIRTQVDVIVAVGTPAVLAAKQATPTIPIVVALIADPVESGLVMSLARPGGNITGLSLASEEVAAKALELLKEAVPKVLRVAMLIDPTNSAHVAVKNKTDAAAKAMSLKLQRIDVRSAADLDGAFAAALRHRVKALLILPLQLTPPDEQRIVRFAVKNRLPTMGFAKRWVEGGGLMVFAPDFPDQVRRTAVYVDKILKGAKPADLPVELPTKFELTVNLKTAKLLGLTLPSSLLVRADRIIE